MRGYPWIPHIDGIHPWWIGPWMWPLIPSWHKCCQNRLEKQQITEFGFKNPNPKAAQIRRSGCECYVRRCHWGHQKGSIPRPPRSTRNASWKRQDMVRSGSVNAPFRTSCFNFEYCLCVPVYPQVGSNYHTLDGEICQVPVVYHFLLAKKTSFPQLFPQRKHHLLVLLSLFKHSGRLINILLIHLESPIDPFGGC